MNKLSILVVGAAVCLFGAAQAGEGLNVEDETTRMNYSLGYQIGGDFKRQGLELDGPAVVKGIEDALSGAEPLIPAEEMRGVLMELKRKIVNQQRAAAAEAELKKTEEGKQYRETYAAKAGVVTTETGLMYQVIEPGSGKTPGPTDKVTVHYRGTLVSGQEFDSSHARGKPATFALNGVIKGWTEGLQHIQEGGKIQLVVPPELAYGDRGALAHQTLVFDVELIAVGDEPTAESPEGDEPAK